MRRIDDETREAIIEVSEDIERDGYAVNRRELAREFGVSPQTVARVLDGPDARRRKPQEEVLVQHGTWGVRVAFAVGIALLVLGWRKRS